MQVYERIYNIVSENYKSAGKKLDYEKQAFLYNTGTHPQVVDVRRYRHLSNLEFYQAVHTAVYHRLPEQEEYHKWSAFFCMNPAAFQRKLLKKISASSVAALYRMRFIGGKYANRRRGTGCLVFGFCYGLTDKPGLRRLGKKLPLPLQRIVRKVFL